MYGLLVARYPEGGMVKRWEPITIEIELSLEDNVSQVDSAE